MAEPTPVTSRTKRQRKVTIKDVARHAGVSHTTVSYVINDKASANISDATKAKVRASIDALGYRPNDNAKSLSTTHSNVVGFVTEDIAAGGYAGETVSSAQEVIWDSGKLMLIVHTDSEPQQKQAALEKVLRRDIEGLIFGSMFHRAFEAPRRMPDLPLVLMNCYDPEGRYSHVVPDDFGGAHQATAHLIGQGHQRIGFILGEPQVKASNQRLAGYRWALEEAGLTFDPSLVTAQPWSMPGGYAGARALLALQQPPTAIFCINDIVAMGCYDALKEAGVAIGDEMAVMGFDNNELAAQMRPALSTVALPHAEMGRWAADRLLQQIRAEGSLPAVHMKMPCPLVLRDSA